MNNPFRRLYEWVLSWARHPAGSWALFANAFVESSFFPIPPDALLVALAMGRPKRSFWYATLCSIGSVLGGVLGYLIGLKFWELTKDFFFTYLFSESSFENVSISYNRNAFLAVLGAGFTPIPYKVFTIAGGVCKINFLVFVVASLIGRSSRFFLVSLLVFIFGERAKRFIERYFNLATIIFFILLAGGILLAKFLL
jgi:membrane protein YqaA with SNARE-associated domain